MSNYVNSLYKDYEKLEIKTKKLQEENKWLKLRVDIAESEQQRLEKINNQIALENEQIINEKNITI